MQQSAPVEHEKMSTTVKLIKCPVLPNAQRQSYRSPRTTSIFLQSSPPDYSSDPDDVSFENKLDSNFSHAYSQRTRNLDKTLEVKAQLVCIRDELGQWKINLTDFKGEKNTIVFLFGYAELVSIDEVIPDEHRDVHHQYVTSILENGQLSQYWDLLFSGKMARPLTTKSPLDGLPRNIDMLMELREELKDETLKTCQYIFDVNFLDKTANNAITDMAAAITHNSRTYLRTGLNIVEELIKKDKITFSNETIENLSPTELQEALKLMIENQKNRQSEYQVLKESLQSSMNMCRASRDKFTKDSVMYTFIKNATSENNCLISVDEALSAFMEGMTQQSIIRENNANLVFSKGNTQSFLTNEKIEILKDFLLNLIINAVQASIKAKSKMIEITTQWAMIENAHRNLMCEVTDNVPGGMPENLRETFFTRQCLHEKSIENKKLNEEDIERNRGEGTKIMANQLLAIGGSAEIFKRSDGKDGTTFKLSIPVSFFKSTTTEYLTPMQTQHLNALQAENHLKGFILLVDDQPFILKMLVRSIKNIISKFEKTQSNSLVQQELNMDPEAWNNQGIFINKIGDWGLVCAANAELALQVILHYPIVGLITDQNISTDNRKMKGTALIEAIRTMPNKKTFPIALNTGDNAEEFHVDNIHYIQKSSTSALEIFLDEILNHTPQLHQSCLMK
jgi:hypothetical protein